MRPREERTIEVVVTAGSVRLEDVFCAKRDPRAVLVRRAVCLVLRDHHQMSYPEIGAAMGTNHSTAIARTKAGRRMLADEAALLARSSRAAAPLTHLLDAVYRSLGREQWPAVFHRPASRPVTKQMEVK